jgi:hypothetical protein
VAPVAVEGALGADGASLQQHPRGLHVASEAGVVERYGVPAVTLVDVGARLEEEGEAVAVAGARCLKEVTAGDLFQGHRRLEVFRVELDVDVEAAELDVGVHFGLDGGTVTGGGEAGERRRGEYDGTSVQNISVVGRAGPERLAL